MNLLWLFPAGFAALAALLLPLLIHLARRSEYRLLDFAALRWVQAKARPRRRLRFDKWPLLLLRLLLLALLALLLARPAVTGVADTRPRVAVLPGLDAAIAHAQVDDAQAQWLWLAPGFPPIDAAAAPPASSQPVSSLLRQLDAELPTGAPLTVLVPGVLDGVDAQRPRLSRAVDWRVVVRDSADAAEPAPTAAAAPTLVIRHDQAAPSALRYLRAAALAWQPEAGAPALDIAPITQPVPLSALPTSTTLVWLATTAPPPAVQQWVGDGGTVLLDAGTAHTGLNFFASNWRDSAGLPLLEQARQGRGRVLRFTHELLPAAMPALLEADFPQRLRAQLQPTAAPTRVDATVHAPLRGDFHWMQPPRELSPWLLWAIALLFVLERWMATSARRGVQS
ncbi:MAG: BatA domain-containing protein [Stenotrophomonas sp.]